MELDHLAEWLRHHAALGIEDFWLYSTGHQVLDSHFGNQGELTWNKKPEADYHLDFTNGEVDKRINKIVRQAQRLYGVKIRLLQAESSPQGVGHVQCLISQDAVNAARNNVDWLGFIDIDELLVGDLSYFSELSDKVAAVQLRQRVFESRWLRGKARPMAAISRHYGTVNFNKKIFANPNHVKRWSNIHRIYPKDRSGLVVQAPPEKIRFHHFRGIAIPKGMSIPHQEMPGLPKYAQLKLQPTHDCTHQPRFDVIIGTMRSGSSLLGHVLSELGYGRYAGETHINLSSEEQIQKAIRKIDQKIENKTPITRPIIEKVVHRRHWANDQYLRNRVGKVYFLHRHPATVWRSLQKTNWKNARLDYLIAHYQWLNELSKTVPPEKLHAICYYDLVDAERFQAQFGTCRTSYALLPTTGKEGWGDPCHLIKSGEIQQRNEADEVRSALKQFSPMPPKLLACVSLYEQLMITLQTLPIIHSEPARLII
ncbi:MAG: glycosyltransferase family 92 protein [Pirellulales bacterium]|nr:glycosyltransferase family 92 protein [Pirellulales bacterium]